MQANAQKVQRRMSNKPRHPAQLAADVVEGVLATGADPYLETRMHSLSWWQLSLLDVKVFLAAVVTAVVVLLGGLAWLLCKLIMTAIKRGLGADAQSWTHIVHKKSR